MKIDYTKHAREALVNAPPGIQKAVFKQMKLLATNLHHPSLRGSGPFSVSPDGRYALFVRYNRRDSDLFLLENFR